MKFNIRKPYKHYLDIQVEIGNTITELGFTDKEEAQNLLEQLESAVEEIKEFIDN